MTIYEQLGLEPNTRDPMVRALDDAWLLWAYAGETVERSLRLAARGRRVPKKPLRQWWVRLGITDTGDQTGRRRQARLQLDVFRPEPE